MKRLDRYIIGVFLGSWAVALVFFLGMYVLIHFFSRANKIGKAMDSFAAAGDSTIGGFLRYYGVNFPFVLVEMLPFTVLMAAMWSLQHMARRNELVPVVTSGVSFRRLTAPLLLAAFLISLAFSAVKEEALPRLARERHRMERMIKGDTGKRMKKLPLIQDGRGNLFHIQEYDVQQQLAHGVDILDRENPSIYRGHVGALRYESRTESGHGWYPVDGAARSGDLSFPLPSDLTPQDIEIESSDFLFLSVQQLARMIERNPDKLNLQVLQHSHYTYPLSSIILMLIGMALVLRGRSRSPYVAAGASLLLSVSFFSLQRVLQDIGSRGDVLNPLLGAWLPIVIFGGIGLILFETIPT